jgi:leader peptidase (prepilin peptidase)/N-methyltransferase
MPDILFQGIPLEIALLWVGIFGLIIGSFLNVVIYRLPLMLERQWRSDCEEFLHPNGGNKAVIEDTTNTLNLLYPPSRCPVCGHGIRWYENIPVLSYLFLLGRCSNCKTPIPLQYPLVEILTAGVSVFLALHFQFSAQFFAALFFTWILIAASVIDLQKKILPNELTYLLLWLGLLISLNNTFVSAEASIVGAISGYLALFSVFMVFKLLTGKDGMGFGDFKLLAALGAWTGWQYLVLIIFLASVLGLIFAFFSFLVQLTKFDKADNSDPTIPFGPFLSIAGFVALVWGEAIYKWYSLFYQ